MTTEPTVDTSIVGTYTVTYNVSDNSIYATPVVRHVTVINEYQILVAKLGKDIDGEAAGDNSGRSVSLSSDGLTVAIGAVGNDGNGDKSGHVRVYKYTAGIWIKMGSDIDGEAAGDNSG
ncbi:MAG: hypothetical protein EBT09_15250, partial [Actinobacteria bacterium]|nr:hypothetical protein [Actinomycetota bacterium]